MATLKFNLLCLAFVTILITTFGVSQAAELTDAGFSGIIEYKYEQNPQRIKPKMYNWEVLLSKADSINCVYEIVQTTQPISGQAEEKVLIDDKMITPNKDGQIHFALYVGDKEPTKNMNGPGNLGLPIIFSGKGTARGESNWIVLPGSKVTHVTPSAQGTQMHEGRLGLIQFSVVNAQNEKFLVDVELRKKL